MSSAWMCLALMATSASALMLQPVLGPTAVGSSLGAARLPARVSPLMQEGEGGERERSRGRTVTIARPKPKAKGMRKEDISHDANWKVLLHNDDVHTFEYCTGAICSVVRTIKRKKAHTITVQAQTYMRSAVSQARRGCHAESCPHSYFTH